MNKKINAIEKWFNKKVKGYKLNGLLISTDELDQIKESYRLVIVGQPSTYYVLFTVRRIGETKYRNIAFNSNLVTLSTKSSIVTAIKKNLAIK